MFRWPDDSTYEGSLVDSKIHGYGTYCWSNEGRVYAGNWQKNRMHGQGNLEYQDGRTYRGSFVKGKKQGNGCFEWPDGRRYRGNYLQDMKHGYGIFEWPDGRKYIGSWDKGKQDGQGVFITANGNRREGEWSAGKLLHWLVSMEVEENFEDGMAAAEESLEGQQPRILVNALNISSASVSIDGARHRKEGA